MEVTATLIEKRQVQTKAPRRIGSAGVPLSAETVPSVTSGTDPVTVPSIQRLLDVISSIIVEEYVMVAKQNPTVFSEVNAEKMGQSPSGTVPIFPHNDER